MRSLSSAASAPIRLGTIALALALVPAHAQTFPTKAIRLVVPNASGGNADLVARMAAEGMSRELSNQVFVDNRAGGRQIPATRFVTSSTPDGHTLLAVGLGYAVNAGLYNDLPYDSIKDLTPVGMVGETPQLVVSAPSFPPNNIKELIALAKAKPNSIHYSSAGLASTNHLGGELLNTLASIQMVHVPYKATAQANTDTMSGIVQLSMAAPSSVVPLIKSGKLKALGISSSKRSAQFPDIPTVSETVPGYELTLWNGISAPAATPKSAIARLNTALYKGISSPDIKERLFKAGVDVNPLTPEEMAIYVEADIKKWAKVVREAGIQGER